MFNDSISVNQCFKKCSHELNGIAVFMRYLLPTCHNSATLNLTTPHCRRTPIWLILGNNAFVSKSVWFLAIHYLLSIFYFFCRFCFVLVKWCVLIKCSCLCYMCSLSCKFMSMSLINFLFSFFPDHERILIYELIYLVLFLCYACDIILKLWGISPTLGQ